MEVEGEEGSKVTLKRASTPTLFGRGLGFNTNDRSVSRKHLLLRVSDDGTAEPGVSFQVLGKNPVWVRSRSGGGIRVYRRSESGEIGVGDRFCVSGRRPVWFGLRKIEDGGGSERNSECESELAESAESVDVSSIDPVKEFGFLVIGHEFDQYPRQMLRNAKHWDWFLDDPSEGTEDSGDGDEGTKPKRRGRRKRRHVEGNHRDDDEWAGESEDEKDVLATVSKAKKPSYWTRSKDNRKVKPPKSTRSDRASQKKRSLHSDDEDVEDEDEDDEETLGGFIVDDEDVEGEQEESEEEEEEEEEEEFIDDEDDE